MTVLVTGVRGHAGARVAGAMAARGVDVRAASSAGTAPDGLDLPVVALDLRSGEGLGAALDGVDRVFLYAASDAIERVCSAMVAAGVRHVVVLSSASVEAEDGGSLGRHHEEVEEAVRAAGLGWTFLRPNAFATNTLAWADGVRAGEIALPFPDAWLEPIHEADIADAAVAALIDPERHRSRAYYLTGGVSMTQREQIGVLAEVLDRDVAVREMSIEEWRTQLRERGAPDYVADSLVGLWERATQGPGRTDGTIADVTGATPRTYAQWVADHRAAFL